MDSSAWFPLIILVAVVGVMFLIMIIATRQPGRLKWRKWFVRWGCGATGVLLFAAVGLGTILNLRDVYRAQASANPAVLIPAKPAVKPPVSNDGNWKTPFKGRFLLRSLIMSNHGLILQAETLDLTWPEARGKTIKTHLNIYGTKAIFERTFNEMDWRHYYGDGRTKTVTVLTSTGSLSFNSENASYLEDFEEGSQDQMHEVPGLYFEKPFSLPVIHVGPVRSLNAIIPIQKDDPLIVQSAYQFCSERMAQQMVQLAQLRKQHHEPVPIDAFQDESFQDEAYSRNGYSMSITTPPLISLAKRTGPAFGILLVGTFLIAQFFRRKALAWVITVFLAMLYMAALDRVVLDRHLRVLSDSGQSGNMRTFACWNTISTFFHHARSEEIFDRFMRDQATPPELRQTIQHAAEIYMEPKVYDTSRLPPQGILYLLLLNGTPRNQATLAELQKKDPLCLWFQQDRVFVAWPAKCAVNDGELWYRESRIVSFMPSPRGFGGFRSFSREYSWPSQAIYRRVRREADGAFSLEFSLKNQVSEDLGLEKGKVWFARFTKQEIFNGFGLGRIQLFPNEPVYREEDVKRHLKLRVLLAHAGVTLK
jgi:hypothetical protein